MVLFGRASIAAYCSITKSDTNLETFETAEFFMLTWRTIYLNSTRYRVHNSDKCTNYSDVINCLCGQLTTYPVVTSRLIGQTVNLPESRRKPEGRI